ncbi:MAG: class I SAM-dependent methyltransferase [Planctomycetota bacterium]
MTDSRDLDRHEGAYRDFSPYHDDNHAMLGWYADRVAEGVGRLGAASLVSLGVGHGVVCGRLTSLVGKGVSAYTVVEGSEAILRQYQERHPPPPGMRLVHGLFEEFHPEQPVDAVEMGFVLEHVDDPDALLRRYASLLAPRGTLFIAVPNALSLHRRIGVAAGLLADPHALSENDTQFGHQRYFDLDSLRRSATAAGLVVRHTEGIYLKPFSTAQMASLRLDREVFLALFRVGQEHPDLCNGIYLEAGLA